MTESTNQVLIHKVLVQEEKLFRGWRDGSVTWCTWSCRGLWLGFQHPQGSSHTICNSSAKDLVPSLKSERVCGCTQ